MVFEHPKPRYSEQMESGVLCFVAWEKVHSYRYGIQCGNKSMKPMCTQGHFKTKVQVYIFDFRSMCRW